MREPIESEPTAAAALFGDRVGLARRYLADLAGRGEELGLIGPQELPRLWTRHVLNSALLAPLLTAGRIGDLGSGAGLPGIPLAIARPDARLVLIEPIQRRADWLRAETERLGLDNVEVLRSRAEDLRLEAPLDQLTARAVSALRTLLPLTAGLVRPGGQLLLLKGARVHEEIEAARRQIARARLSEVEVLVLGGGLLPEETRVFRATVN
ncbi:MAG: 16S rRNA (guanine(527)-N(7))-methyltransferase RsmG [Microbacteriaceae bacterium]